MRSQRKRESDTILIFSIFNTMVTDYAILIKMPYVLNTVITLPCSLHSLF